LSSVIDIFNLLLRGSGSQAMGFVVVPGQRRMEFAAFHAT